jgi:hypothetical protein
VGWRQRLYDLDRRSGFAEMQADSAEFFAPLNLLATVLVMIVAVWEALERQWQVAGFFAFFSLLSALTSVAGFARRRRRNAIEDPWQPL